MNEKTNKRKFTDFIIRSRFLASHDVVDPDSADSNRSIGGIKMKYTVRLKESNQKGHIVRDKLLMSTDKYSRAVSAFHQHTDEMSGLSNGRSQLMIMDGEIVKQTHNL